MDLSERLVKERRARLAAERLLEQKSRELFAANEKLAIHARSLSDQIVEQRQVVKSALSEAELLKNQNTRFVEDLDRAHTAAVMAERRLWDALETSRKTVRSKGMETTGIIFALLIINFLFGLLFLIPMIISLPITMAAISEMYDETFA